MKKLILLLTAALMVLALFAGCTNVSRNGNDDEERESKSPRVSQSEGLESDEISAEAPATSGFAGTGNPASDSYLAFTGAKSSMLSRLADGLGSNDAYALMAFALMGPTMIDLVFLPVSMSGLGEEAAMAGLSMFNATGVRYSESGNTYTIAYTSEEQDDNGNTVSVVYEFVSTYDPASKSMVSTASKNGEEALYMEYRQTSFGWVGQYASLSENSEAAFEIIYITIQGEDGVVGIGESATMPAPLTGGESVDFPKVLPKWFAIEGNTITGLSDGSEFNFEYEPSES